MKIDQVLPPKWILALALVSSLALNVFLYASWAWQGIQIEFARDILDIVLTAARDYPDEDQIEYIRGYYPPGTKLAEDTKLSRMVEDVREYVLEQVEDEDAAE